ncbi:MAG: glycosyltransferase [Candidatus Zixiibacteriota bacterium]
MPPRVLFCDSSADWGGVEHWMTITAGELHRRGWSVTVAGRAKGELLARSAAAGVPTVGWPFRWVIDPVTVWAARRYMLRERPELTVVALGNDIRTVKLASASMRIPIVWRLGVPYPRLGMRHRLTGKGGVDRVIVPSQFMAARLAQNAWLKGKIDVIPNGLGAVEVPSASRVAQTRRDLGWRDDEIVILWVGRFKLQKGVDTLLQAFAALRRLSEPQQLRLVLVGTGPEDMRLRRLSESLGLEHVVEFAGYQREPSPYFDACDILALPSHVETFGNVLLEAMARAKPIVASNTGGIPEVVGPDSALLVPAQDESALTASLHELVSNLSRRRTMGEAGRQRFLAHFTLERMGDDIESSFRRILDPTLG